MNLGKKHLATVLLVCIGLRLAFFGTVHPWIPEVEREVVLRGDSQYYDKLANTLLESHRFAYSSAGRPDALRTPLYPLFISGIYFMFGHAPWAILLAQILLDALSCLLLLLTLARLFNSRVALIAAVFYALDPFLILYSSELVSEILFVFLLIAAFYFFGTGVSSITRNARWRGYGLASLLLGLATLARPVSKYAPLVLIIFFFVRYRYQLKTALRYSLVCGAIFVLVLSPWLIRNLQVFGRLALSTSDSYNLLVLNVVPMEREKRKLDSGTVKQALLLEADSMMVLEGKNPEGWNQFDRADYWRRLAIKYIKNDPLGLARFYCLGVVHTFGNLGTSEFARVLRLNMAPFDIKAYTSLVDLAKGFVRTKGSQGFFIAAFVFPYLLVSYFGMALGLAVAWRRYDRGVLLFSLLSALYFVLITGVAGLARFRLPSVPFYLPFVGIGLDYLWKKGRRTASPFS